MIQQTIDFLPREQFVRVPTNQFRQVGGNDARRLDDRIVAVLGLVPLFLPDPKRREPERRFNRVHAVDAFADAAGINGQQMAGHDLAVDPDDGQSGVQTGV